MGMTRSENMARIKGTNTTPELILRKALKAAGIHYRLRRRVPTENPVCRPDLVSIGRRIAVFVDGCQWHGCPDHFVRARTNTERWNQKS